MEDGDQDFICQLYQKTSRLSTLQQDKEYMALYRSACWEEVNRPGVFNVMLILKGTNEFVGKICMQQTELNLPEIGISILDKFQNMGLGTQSVIAFCNWYSAENKCYEVRVRIREENTHSASLFEKIGAEKMRSVSLIPESLRNVIIERLPEAELAGLFQKNIRDYRLRLPIHTKQIKNEVE
jgi:RimJ/RimL family protein N-acetyltransferase